MRASALSRSTTAGAKIARVTTAPSNDVLAARQHTIGELLARTAVRSPNRLALVWGERRETFAELDATVNRVAHAIAAAGVRQGDRVVMLAHNSREFVLVHFALAKLGAISVPVNFMLNADEVAFIIEHSGATSFVVEDSLAPVMLDAIDRAGVGERTVARGLDHVTRRRGDLTARRLAGRGRRRGPRTRTRRRRRC